MKPGSLQWPIYFFSGFLWGSPSRARGCGDFVTAHGPQRPGKEGTGLQRVLVVIAELVPPRVSGVGSWAQR
jgi:hypothetical protein